MIFRGAIEAATAAADAQRAVAAEPWPDGATIRVRMGLHTGEIESSGSDVIGYAINRTARIAAVAHGGQVLLCDATRAVVAGELPDGVSLRDLGEHRLKDLRAPERLAQLVIEGLTADFPALRSLDARPNNLPTQLTTFVGRERELAEAGELLRATRLLTLTGPGGTGKTRLSLQVAGAAADEFPDGIWFVALEAVRDPDLVAPTIARTLGLSDSGARSPVDALVDHLGDRRVLLVLDNFEQVVAAGAVVADLLRRCPSIAALVTTRIALRVSGEQEYPVPGLPAPPDTSRLSEMERLNLPRAVRDFDLDALNQFEAVRLFIARAGAVKPGFTVTNANAPAVAGIAARLHGMPLAMELAAARLKLLSPDQILARLEHHLAVLTAGSRDLPERQQTLRGAIAWSYDLLDAGAQRLVDRLSVFRGGFELEMAEVVCGPAEEIGGDVVDRLGELVDQSLVRLDEEREVAPVRDARDDPRVRVRDAGERRRRRRGRRPPCRGDAGVGRARRAGTVRIRPADMAGPARAGARQPARCARLGDDPAGAATGRPTRVRAVAVLAAARLPQRGPRPPRRHGSPGLGARTGRSGAVRRGVGRYRVLAVRSRHGRDNWYEEALRLWRSIGDKGEIANALYNRAYADIAMVMAGDVPRAGSTLDEKSWRRPSSCTASSVTNAVRGTWSGEWAATTSSPPMPRRHRTGTSARWTCIGPAATVRWRRGRCTCWPSRRSANATSTRPANGRGMLCATSTRPATCRG